MERMAERLKATRGSQFSIDVNISNSQGDPFMIYSEDSNPFLIFTVASAKYKQEGDYRVNYWLNLSKQYIANDQGQISMVDSKTFMSTQAFYTTDFDYTVISGMYPGLFSSNDGHDNYYGNYLFYTSANGKRVYKYYDGEAWIEYNMRVIQSFDTKDWVEQTYQLQVKYVAGQTPLEKVKAVLDDDTITEITDEVLERIDDKAIRAKLEVCLLSNIPLYEVTKEIPILNAAQIDVASDLQGGD